MICKVCQIAEQVEAWNILEIKVRVSYLFLNVKQVFMSKPKFSVTQLEKWEWFLHGTYYKKAVILYVNFGNSTLLYNRQVSFILSVEVVTKL